MGTDLDLLGKRKSRGGMTKVGLVAAAVLVVLLAMFGFTLRDIYQSVSEVCQMATERHDGDNVTALMVLIESDTATYEERNRAIWALGQLGDERALPRLRALDTSEVQTKPYDRTAYIVQYSVEKAIRQIESDFTLTRWMYRGL